MTSGELKHPIGLNFAFPNSWRVTTLRSVTTGKFGTICPTSFPDEEFEYYSIPAFQENGKPIDELGRKILSNKLVVKNGTVLFGKLNPRVLKVWLVNSHSTRRKIATTEFLPILPNATATPEYIYFVCQSEIVVSEARRLVSGSTPSRERVEPSSFYRIQIPLPPIPDQQAIVQVLQTVQKAQETRQQELALERERKAALMEHLFSFGADEQKKQSERTPYGLVPSEWAVRLLDDCAVIQTGVAKGRKLKTNDKVSVPYLRVANVQNGYLNLEEMKEIEILTSELPRYQLAKGDVVLTEGGDFDKLGRGFVWNGEFDPCVHQNHVFAVRPNRDVITPEYFAYLAQSPYGRAYFLSVAHKTTNLACINKTKLGNFPVLIPSLDEQEKIAAILKACDSKIAAEEHEAVHLQELFDALLADLFSGQCDLTPLIAEEVQA